MKERLNVTTGRLGDKLPHLLAPNKKKNIKPSIYVARKDAQWITKELVNSWQLRLQEALLLQRDCETRLSVQILPTHDGGIYRA